MSGGGQGSSGQGASSLGAFGFNAMSGGSSAPNQSYGDFNQGGYGSQMSSSFQGGYGGYGSPFQGGYGYGGGYGPIGNMRGNDLISMYNTYGGNPQTLASQMQYSGISPFNMQQAGVMSPQEYTNMYRPSSQYQGQINPTQYYQPIYQTQYQNYASPTYYPQAYQNNMMQGYQSPLRGIYGLLGGYR